MRDIYSEDYDSVAGDAPDQLIPASAQKLAGAVVFLGLVAAMGVWSYRLGTRDATEVPVIRAMEGPARIAPADPGGLQAEHQGLEVNAVLAGTETREPTPPAKAEAAPPILADEDAPRGELIIAQQAKEEAAKPEATEIVATSNDAAPPAAGAAPNIQSELVAMVEAAAPAAETAVAADETAAGTDEAALAETPPETVMTTRPMVRPANLAIARPKPAETLVKTAEAEPAPVSATREVKELGKGARLVQLGAYDSEEIARDAWARLVKKQGDLLGSKSLYVERATSNARVFYRLRVAGFQDTEQTRAMCEALKARGVDCIPVTLQ